MRKFYFIFLFCGLLASDVSGQWLNVYSGQSNAIAFPSANIGYFGFGKNIKKTTDGGVTWKILRTGLPDMAQSQPVYINHIQFLSNNVGFISDYYGGFLLKTKDGGTTWEYLSNPPSSTLVGKISFQFLNENVGFRIAERSIYKTTDGGVSWTNLLQISGFGNAFAGLAFLDQQNGSVFLFDTIGVNPTVKMYTTSDGGVTWTIRNVPTLAVVNTAHFRSPTVGYVAGTRASNINTGAILRTADGGLTWSETALSKPPQSIKFYDNNFGVAVGGTSATTSIIAVTTDGGITWEEKAELLSGSGIYQGIELKAVDIIDANTFVAAGGNNHNMIKSSNRGTTVNPLGPNPLGVANYLYDVFAVNSNVMYAAATFSYTPGAVHVKKTTDGGQNWVGIPSQLDLTGFNALWFSSESTGYGAGPNGIIQKTTDGAQTWTTQSFGLANILNDIKFIGTTGYAVSAEGKILKTTNGTSWSLQTSPVTTSLEGIHMFDATHVIVVGKGGVILKTSNGATWTSVSSPTTSGLNAVHFPTPLIGYAVGDGGKIIKTANGGDTWTSQASGVTSTLYTVFFLDQTFGYAGGDGSASAAFFATTDGGANWNRQSLEGYSSAGIKSIIATSTTSAVAVGYAGVYLSTCSNPSFLATPQSQSLTTGETIVLSSNVNGIGTVNYTWKKDNVDLGVNNSNLTITNAQVSHSGSYSLTVTDNCGTTTVTGINVVVRSTEPAAQPTAFNFFFGTPVRATFKFTAPAAAPTGYIVLRKNGSAPSDVPVDGTAYTRGNTIGTSTVAYVGADPTFEDTGLTTQITYNYAVFAYNGSGASINYRTNTPLRGTSLSQPPVNKPTNFKLTNATLAALSFSYAASSDADGYIVLRNKLTASADVPTNTLSYARGDLIGEAIIVHIGNKVSLSFDDETATPGWVYVYRVFPFRGSGLGTNYFTYTPLTGTSLSDEPQNHVSNITFTEVKSTSVKVSFTKSLDNPSGYLILRKKGSASAAVPIDGVVYQSGQTIDDATIAHIGTETSFDETSLESGTQYYYSVFAFNGVGASANYLISPSTNNLGIVRTLSASPEAIPAISVLFNSFTARWNPVVGAASYKLDISTSETFDTFVDDYNGKQTTFLVESVDNLKANTDYYYRVRSVNSGGDSEPSNTIKVKTADVPVGTTALQLALPTFSAAFPSDEQSQKVSVVASGGAGSRRGKLFYRGISADDYTTIDVTPSASNANLFEATITRAMLDDIGVQFRFVLDDAAYTASTPLATIRRAYSANNSPVVPLTVFGGIAETYRLISIPLNMEDNSIKSIFESVLGGYDDTKWRLVRYQNNAYVDYPSFEKIELGKSYWFNSTKQVTVKAGVSSTPVYDQSTPYKLSLTKGWNQIATPYPFTIDWRDVLSFNGNPTDVGRYKVFNPSTQSFAESTELQPFSGGFVFSNNPIDLTIPVTMKAGSGRRAAEEIVTDISEPNWQLPVALSQKNVVSELGAIGMNVDANLSRDKFDDITLPRFLNFLEFNNYHNDYIAPRFSKDIVPTSGEHSWNLVVESNLGDSDITMTWDNGGMGNNEAQMLLFHPESGTLLNMKNVGSFTFRNRDRNNFKILFSANPVEKINGTTMMGVAYPNPSSDEFNFKVLTHDQLSAQVEIFDLVGRRVYSSQHNSTGLITDMNWPAIDSNGTKVQRGIYIYKIRSSGGDIDFRKEGKLILH